MKANELMIGDWVYEGNDHPIQVSRNYGRSIMYKEEYSNEVEETCLNPIPLTEEILKANGFKYYDELKEFCHKGYCGFIDFEVTYDLEFGISINNINLEINYVHELQRALRCCGLFDLANNFKIK